VRWRVALWLNQAWAAFPLGTLLVNCAGGLLIGVALAAFERTPHDLLRLLLVTGFLGGMTTFSAFSGESLALLLRGQWAWATAHTMAHVAGALACTGLGYAAFRAVFHA
jgi:CrcB protein